MMTTTDMTEGHSSTTPVAPSTQQVVALSLALPRQPRPGASLSDSLGNGPTSSEPRPLIAPVAPVVVTREDAFGVRLWCTGTILEVNRDMRSFRAELVDDRGTRSVADIDLEDVDPSEREWVVTGNRFTYVVFHEQRSTGLVNSDQLILEPLRLWTNADNARAAARRALDLSFLDAE